MHYCSHPFSYLEIHVGGIIYPCCPIWCNGYSFGSIYEESFDDVWNSQKAMDFRQQILNGEYSLCNTKMCYYQVYNQDNDNIPQVHSEYPKFVRFANDRSCNYQCITCRDKLCVGEKDYTDFLNSKIESVFLPMLKNAETVFFSGNGDPFVSNHYKKLIKEIARAYPKIKFSLHTNGSLCNYKNCEELGILDKLQRVEVSIHSINQDTYKTITVNGNYDNVMKNVKWLSELKKAGGLEELVLSFVVHKLNYKEMPGFVKIAENLGATASFWEYRDWGTEFGRQYQEMAIFEESHPEYDNFINVITQDIFQSPNCGFNTFLKKLSQS